MTKTKTVKWLVGAGLIAAMLFVATHSVSADAVVGFGPGAGFWDTMLGYLFAGMEWIKTEIRLWF